MKCYMLLRDNQESGPYTHEEIIAKDLRPNDLVWKVRVSAQWLYPTEIDELKAFVIKPVIRAVSVTQKPEVSAHDMTKVAVKKPQPSANLEERQVYNYPVAEVAYSQSMDYNKEFYFQPAKGNNFSFQKTLTKENPVWLFALMGALIFGAFVVKQMVEVLGTRTVASTDFSAIAAPIGAVAEDKVPDKPIDIAYQNALHKQVVVEKAEKAIRKTKVKDLKKQVKISGTDYKVGVLGGINNLDLTVSNNSLHPLERVVIEVKYFKANGKTVSTEEYNLFNVAPGTERTLEVPDNTRGVKVKYRIVGVESKKFKAALREV